MKYRMKLWTGISAAALIAASSAVAGKTGISAHDGSSDGDFRIAAMGEGAGEGQGEGGEGGEGGVDPAAAATDPVAYLTALDIIRAHYLAGIAMLDVEGSRLPAGEMFAHPISEVYIDLEPVFEARGVALFMDDMTDAVELALGDASAADVEAAAAKVLAALDAAADKAPASDRSALQIEAALTAGMFERAAKQYDAATSTGGTDEAWLDGYGFWKVAEARAATLLTALDARDDAGALQQELREAREVFGLAYKRPTPPADADIPASTLLAASSRILLKSSRL